MFISWLASDMFDVQSFHVISEDSLTADILVLWLLKIFLHLFCDFPWPHDIGLVMWIYQVKLHISISWSLYFGQLRFLITAY